MYCTIVHSEPMARKAIVIGGGVIGTSAALHLAERGAEVTLFERGRIGAGTTSAGGGFVALWAAGAFPGWGEEELELERYALSFYADLAADGFEFDYLRNGSLWLAASEAGWDAHLRPLAEHPGVPEKRILGPGEIDDVTAGVVPAAGVVGGVLHPQGIQITTAKAARALAERCRLAGVEIHERAEATELVVESGRATGIATADGVMGADAVVIAAGAWSIQLLRAAGYRPPMVPLVATRLVTEPLGIPETLPTLMVEELSFTWIRGDRGRLLWGCEYEVAPRYEFVDREPPPAIDGIDPGEAVAETLAVGRRAAAVVPALGELGERSPLTVAHGMPCYTADMRALVGPVPGLEGLYLASGDNQAGVTHAPGYGRMVAELVTAAEPSVDPAAFRLERFSSADAGAIAGGAAERIFELSAQDPRGPDAAGPGLTS
jgi:sarcosine oxidase subunit beta